MTPASPSWSPSVYADRLPALRARTRVLGALRRRFATLGFEEVETPILQVSPGNEEHLEAFATVLAAPDGSRTPLYLHTSPEFAMKTLLAAGERRIFTFAGCSATASGPAPITPNSPCWNGTGPGSRTRR